MTDVIRLKSVKEYAKLLKEEHKLTDFEALSLGIQMQRNDILKRGLGVSSDDKSPSGIEAIAMKLGYETHL